MKKRKKSVAILDYKSGKLKLKLVATVKKFLKALSRWDERSKGPQNFMQYLRGIHLLLRNYDTRPRLSFSSYWRWQSGNAPHKSSARFWLNSRSLFKSEARHFWPLPDQKQSSGRTLNSASSRFNVSQTLQSWEWKSLQWTCITPSCSRKRSALAFGQQRLNEIAASWKKLVNPSCVRHPKYFNIRRCSSTLVCPLWVFQLHQRYDRSWAWRTGAHGEERTYREKMKILESQEIMITSTFVMVARTSWQS